MRLRTSGKQEFASHYGTCLVGVELERQLAIRALDFLFCGAGSHAKDLKRIKWPDLVESTMNQRAQPGEPHSARRIHTSSADRRTCATRKAATPQSESNSRLSACRGIPSHKDCNARHAVARKNARPVSHRLEACDFVRCCEAWTARKRETPHTRPGQNVT